MPRLRAWRMTRCATRASACSASLDVASVEPSSTKMTSACGSWTRSQSQSSPSTGAMFSASLNANTMTDSVGVGG